MALVKVGTGSVAGQVVGVYEIGIRPVRGIINRVAKGVGESVDKGRCRLAHAQLEGVILGTRIVGYGENTSQGRIGTKHTGVERVPKAGHAITGNAHIDPSRLPGTDGRTSVGVSGATQFEEAARAAGAIEGRYNWPSHRI